MDERKILFLSKKEKFYILLAFIFVLTIHSIYNFVDTNNIITLIIGITVCYLLYNFIMNKKIHENKKNAELKNIEELRKYKILSKYNDIVLFVNESSYLQDINKISYTKLLFMLNKFFILYEQLLNINLNDKILYDNLLYISKEILNILNSFGTKLSLFSSPNNSGSLNNMPNIEKLLNNLKIILSKYLQKIYIKINSKWNLSDIDINTSPVYPDDIPGRTENNDNYNVY